MTEDPETRPPGPRGHPLAELAGFALAALAALGDLVPQSWRSRAQPAGEQRSEEELVCEAGSESGLGATPRLKETPPREEREDLGRGL